MLADFVISHFRRELGLWYEINEGSSAEKYINPAHLTDGSSFLMLWFTTDSSPFTNSRKLHVTGGLPLFIAWETREDSRQHFYGRVVEAIAVNAVESYCESRTPEHCALLSCEVRVCSTFGGIKTLVGDSIPREEFQVMPQYRGKMFDLPDFELIPDPGECWGQFVFNPRKLRGDVVRMFAPYLVGFDSFDIGSNVCFEANFKWRPAGVDKVWMLSRIY